jgi:hypothetical protein
LVDLGVLSNLPADLAYLAEPAMRYGCYQFDDDIFAFLDRATDNEMSELALIAERVRINNQNSFINRFFDQFDIADYEESACLYFLFAVMDYAGLEFDTISD